MALNDDRLEIHQLRERYENLNTKKITAEANLNTSKTTLDELKRQARETYGTDGLEQLRAKLEELKQANEAKRASYQQHITEIEKNLAEVERQHAESLKSGAQP